MNKANEDSLLTKTMVVIADVMSVPVDDRSTTIVVGQKAKLLKKASNIIHANYTEYYETDKQLKLLRSKALLFDALIAEFFSDDLAYIFHSEIGIRDIDEKLYHKIKSIINKEDK